MWLFRDIKHNISVSQSTKLDDSCDDDDNDDDYGPFAVALQAVIHEEVEDGVGIDGDESDREGEEVVEVVQGEEVAGWLVPDELVKIFRFWR